MTSKTRVMPASALRMVTNSSGCRCSSASLIPTTFFASIRTFRPQRRNRHRSLIVKSKALKLPGFKERQSILGARRNPKMARSAHAYVRGNTRKFYEWLGTAAGQELPRGPAVWICGDCHVGNLGPVANTDGRIDIQIRDLD